MESTTSRAAQAAFGSVQAVALADPETGKPVVYNSTVTVTPGSSAGAVLFVADLTGVITATVQLMGTWTATVSFEATIDGTNWFAIYGYPNVPSSTPSSGPTGNGTWVIPAYGKQLRARISSYTSGTVTANVLLSDVPTATLSNFGSVTVNALPAGTNAIGDVGVQYRTNSTGAASIAKVTAAASTNATSAKASAGRVLGFRLYNASAAVKFVKFYNKASAPTVGTDVPVFTVGIAPNSDAFFNMEGGISFATGIAYAITGAYADADTTAVAAGDVIGAIFYA